MIKKKLISVIDSQEANFYWAEGFKIKAEDEKLLMEKSTPMHDVQQLRQGMHSGGVGRHSTQIPSHFFDPKHTKKESEQIEFGKKIADHLLKLKREKKYDELILVAGAKMLGSVRESLNKEVSSIISKEIPKELCKLNSAELEKHIFH